MVSSYGAYVAGLGTLIFVVLIIEAFIKKRIAENNPWGEGATTLVDLSSPPPSPCMKICRALTDWCTQRIWNKFDFFTSIETPVAAGAGSSVWTHFRDFSALLKPRVMSLVIFTGFVACLWRG